MRDDAPRLRVGLIGYGGMGRVFLQLAKLNPSMEVCAVLLRHPTDDANDILPSTLMTMDFEAFRATRCDVVAECAGHAAVRLLLPVLLSDGSDCVVASVGALADSSTEQSLLQSAKFGGRLIVPSGAVGGLDLIAAAQLGGLNRVTYQSRKPPRAWLGSPAESVLDLTAVAEPTRFFAGTARQAATQYPQNANVAAAVALAGLGFDDTEVELFAVPGITENRHTIQVEGVFGRSAIEIAGNPLPNNPKTSYLAALSVLRAVTNVARRVVV